jgi:hypothetical protein
MKRRFRPVPAHHLLGLAIIAFVAGSLGSILLLSSKATTPTAAVETERGTITGASTPIDNTASNGHAVKFADPLLAHNLLIPTTGALLGVSTSSKTASGLPDLETPMGRKFDVDVNFWDFGNATSISNISASTLSDDASNDRTPMVTWQPQLSGSSADIIPDITAGTYDTYLKAVATQLKAFNKPIFLRYGHEMNGNWYPWSGCATVSGKFTCSSSAASEYVAAWKHVYNLFKANGASNVIWVWCANDQDVSSGGANHHWSDFYPGDAYVDWVSFDKYSNPNSYTAAASSGVPTVTEVKADWSSAEHTRLMYASSTSSVYIDYNLTDGVRSKKPIFVAENMNGPDTDDNINQLILNGKIDLASYDKSIYFSGMVGVLQQFPGIKGIAFFDHYTSTHNYCLNERDCHPPTWNGQTLPTPNASSSTKNFDAYLAMSKNCYLDTRHLQTACQ